IESSLDTAPRHAGIEASPRRRPPPNRWRWAAGAAAAAAAVLLTLWLSRQGGKPVPGNGEREDEVFEVLSAGDGDVGGVDPVDGVALVVGHVPLGSGLEPGERLEVVRPDEITIISMEAADLLALVVGEPPIAGPLDLATRDEIKVDSLAPHPADETTPYL